MLASSSRQVEKIPSSLETTCQSIILSFVQMNCELMLTYDTPALRQTGSRNLTGPKTLPTIWGTYMKLVTKYQISAINSCWEKCDEKCAYMFNVYKNQLSRQTGSRNLTGPKTLPTIWHTYMKLLTKYQSLFSYSWFKKSLKLPLR
jgi:16S rRNA G527 N7-methylase RsmG